MYLLETMKLFGFELNKTAYYIVLGAIVLVLLFLIGLIRSFIEKKKKNKKD